MNIYWDFNNQQIVGGLTSRSKVAQYDFFLRDVIPVDLILVNAYVNATQAYAATALGSGQSISFGAKEAYADTDFLFSSSTWTASGSGTTQKYVGEIDMNTTELIAAVTADTLNVKAEFTIVQSDNSHALTTQFAIKVTKDVISGTEGTPTSEYPVIQQFTDTDDVAKVRLVNSAGVTCFVAAPL